MPRPRPDALWLPKVSWTAGTSGTAVSYGGLVGTPSTIVLLPRRGSETAGFTLTLRWLPEGPSDDDLWQFLAHAQPLEQLEAALLQSLPQWQTRCVYPLAQLGRFEVLRGWKLWLGVSAVVQVSGEEPTALRIPDRSHLEELRSFYAARLQSA